MSGPVAVHVVTDSTACLDAELTGEHTITVVPLQVVVEGRSLAEGVEVSSAQVARALQSYSPVTTSRPSPAAFAEVYRQVAERGSRSIVSVHLSADLSGTVDAARLAARTVADDGIDVLVVDSRTLGLGLGFAVLAAARAAAQGGSAQQVADAASRCALASSAWIYVDTLEYLKRGGRITAAAAMVGSALAVKPLLHLVDGRIEPLDRVRTASRALSRLEELVEAEVGGRAVDIGVQHLAAAERAEQLASALKQRLPHCRSVVVREVGAVLAAHAGPGVLAVVCAPAAS